MLLVTGSCDVIKYEPPEGMMWRIAGAMGGYTHGRGIKSRFAICMGFAITFVIVSDVAER
jgi:hypothetical protein